MSNAKMSRRNFLSGASVAAVGVAAAGMLAGCAPKSGDDAAGAISTVSEAGSSGPSNGYETRIETDILVVGGGQSGFCAGLRALELGAKVTLIDKVSGQAPDFGGSSYRSGGSWLSPVDESDQAVADYIDVVYNYGEGHTDKELITVMGERNFSTLQWMMDQGCEYSEPKVNFPAFPAILTRSTGVQVSIPLLHDNFVDNGGEMLFGTKALDLLMDGQGVCGVLARDEKGYFNITAKKVLLCTGGYAAGSQFLEDHVEDGDEIISRTPTGIVGDGIYMAQKVGGWTVQSSGIKSVYLIPMSPYNLEGGRAGAANKYICVNENGERYVDETWEHWRHGQVLLAQPNAACAYVADSRVWEDIQSTFESFEKMGIETGEFETLDEVAGFVGCPSDKLKATVEAFNASIVEDRTEGLAVDKTSEALPIDTPPYYVLYPIKAACSLIYGGLKTNANSQVLERDGSAVPNLYASGELQGGFFYNGYFGGTQMSKAAIFGHVAAEHAVENL